MFTITIAIHKQKCFLTCGTNAYFAENFAIYVTETKGPPLAAEQLHEHL